MDKFYYRHQLSLNYSRLALIDFIQIYYLLHQCWIIEKHITNRLKFPPPPHTHTKEKKKTTLTDTITGLSYNICIWIWIYKCHHLYGRQLILLQTNNKRLLEITINPLVVRFVFTLSTCGSKFDTLPTWDLFC